MKEYRLAVVGVGMVGSEIIRVLRQREFPAQSIRILARSARTETIDGVDYEVVAATENAFEDMDIALFAGTEGAKGASQTYGWEAVKRGCIVIDNGNDFRMDARVPLVVPEINAHALRAHQGFVANPNCSTIQMVMAVAPLHRAARVKRIVVSTYQAVSGTGSKAVMELERQVQDVPAGKPPVVEQYPHQIFNNVIPQVGSQSADFPGYTSEEVKMVRETHKILEDDEIALSATCARVPIGNSHSEAINIEFEKEMDPKRARELLSQAPGLRVVDDLDAHAYPLALDASGGDEVLVGRIRKDPFRANCIDMWCVADNIRKGAALNAVQIAEEMVRMGLL